jgi:cytochrome d ubiquinol oxidase subunit II
MIDLNTTWFLLIFVLLIGYVVLDGFDLGVGVLHLLARNDHERRVHLNAIGPVWDGNEVWLLTGGGALFAAFPPVYATIFSGFYIALMLLLLALIARAVSMEFRSKIQSGTWRFIWDTTFGLSSLVAALLLGVAFGNVLRGVPIDADGAYVGSFIGLLNPFALLVGVTGLVLLVLHGSAYMAIKTEDELHDRIRARIPALWVVFIVLYLATTVSTYFAAPHLFSHFGSRPLLWVLVLAVLASAVYLPVAHAGRRDGRVFLCTSVLVVGLIGTAATGLYPALAPSSVDPAFGLTAYNASSTRGTLSAMLIIALIGVPIVLVYTAATYWVFRGKVHIDDTSY